MERNHTLYKCCLWHHLLDQRKKLLDVERFQDHAFLSCQVFLHLRTRRQHNDLRMLTTGVKPARAEVREEVRRVDVWETQIEEQQRRTIAS